MAKKPIKRSLKKVESGSPLVPELPTDEHHEELIDEGLAESFPASDPVSVPAPKPDRKKKKASTKRRRTK